MAVKSPEEFMESLEKVKPRAFIHGELVEDLYNHPLMQPSVNTMKLTYKVSSLPEWQAKSTLLEDETISLWTAPYFTKDALKKKVDLERMLGRLTGSCFQRCVGMDMISAAWSATYDVDQKKGTEYHKRFKEWLKYVQKNDLAIGGVMTDVKGDRSKRPNQQQDPDMFVHVVERKKDGIVVRGAKAHITGALMMHELFVLPTQTMRKGEEDYAVAFCIPNNTKGITHILGRVPSDVRRLESSLMDTGNIDYGVGSHETLVVFDDVFVPWERVFLCGEVEHSMDTVWRFAAYHRENGCKPGVFDTLIGATALAAEFNGLKDAGHIKDKISDMIINVEALYACAIAASATAIEHPSGIHLANPIYASCSKNLGSKWVYEICNHAHDITGGIVVTMPSEKDLRHPEAGKYVKKYLKGVADVDTEDRMKIIRYIEQVTMGPMQVEICVGAGPSQAERTVMRNMTPIEDYKNYARKLAKLGQK